MRKQGYSGRILLIFLGAAILAGCGTTGETGSAGAHGCTVSCHDSHGVVQNAVASSPHGGIGCGGCHGDWRHSSCDFCHSSGSVPASFVSPDRAGRCLACHGDLGAPHTTAGSQQLFPAAYLSDRNLDACCNCHNPHDDTPNRQIFSDWAASGHGDVTGGAWTTYPWRVEQYPLPTCRRCHTATAFVAAVEGETAVFGQGANGVLDCTACHADYTYRLRQSGAYTADYTVRAAGGLIFPASFAYPGESASTLCLYCHTGRNSGEGIAAFADGGGNLSDVAFATFSPHYLAAGGILHRGAGYRFNGRGYDNVSYFKHDLIGSAGNPGGVRGACVGCHMYPQRHTLQALQTDGDGTVTGIAGTVCRQCHSGDSALSPASLNEAREQYAAALALLNRVMATKGYVYQGAYPYFSNSNWNIPYGNGDNTLGAAFNYALLLKEPGAWAHNPIYTKRLLYDSIDWMDNGALDDSVRDTVAAYAAEPFQAAAELYFTLDNGNVARP